MKENQLLWRPSKARIDQSQISAFLKKAGWDFDNYGEFHRFSLEKMDLFWRQIVDHFSVIVEGEKNPVLHDNDLENYSWFPNLKLNFAENLLRHRHLDKTAINFIHESGMKKEISYKELGQTVSRLQAAIQHTIGPGDVLAAYMPNIPETVISMLACTSLGGVFTSTSSDFGVEGVMDRFLQSRPKILIAAGAYQYDGKIYDLSDRLVEIEKSLPCLQKIVVVDFLQQGFKIDRLQKGVLWEDFLKENSSDLSFARMPFAHPAYIAYSSGTTGRPKCLVHSIGGTLLQHIKELGLHTDLDQHKNIFYFTTCGWMMWNWLVSSLCFGSKITLFEGSPKVNSLGDFFEMIDREEINIFGTSPKFLQGLEKSGYRNQTGLPSLQTILSTGSPLLPEQFDFVYQKLKKDVCLSSISGGTDIISCFMLGNPSLPVYRGEIQCLGLGMDVACFDEEGKPQTCQQGELVCRRPFPSRPIYLLGDDSSKLMHSTYFSRFKGIWHHGDFISINERGGVRVYGRSDATLNPGGVRIGTAEIYRQVEKLAWVEDGLCIGRPDKGDVRIVLFVKMKDDQALSDERKQEIKELIKSNTTSRHVPKEIWSVKDIPYTRSGKKMEMLISRIFKHQEPANLQAVANPECLSEYRKILVK